MIVAFGKEWDDQRLKDVCAEIATLADTKAWRQFESLAMTLAELQKDKFATAPDYQTVREIAGTINGIKKVLAITEDCRQILSQDKQ